MKKWKILVMFIAAAMLVGCGHKHVWQEATCTEPRTCSECGVTEGEALGHSTDFGKCERCGEAIGADGFTSAVSLVAEAERQFNASFNAIFYSGASSYDDFYAAVDRNYSGYDQYVEKMKKAIEVCGDDPNLATYKTDLQAAVNAVPSKMSSSSESAFNTFVDGSESVSTKMYIYQGDELSIYEKLGLNPRHHD